MSVVNSEQYIDTLICPGITKTDLSKRNTRIKKTSDKSFSEQEQSDEPQEKKPIRRFLLGDLTLFFNSLERSLDLLRYAGFKGDMEKTECDGKIVLSITLEKSTEKR